MLIALMSQAIAMEVLQLPELVLFAQMLRLNAMRLAQDAPPPEATPVSASLAPTLFAPFLTKLDNAMLASIATR
jgi:hypothetical protein